MLRTKKKAPASSEPSAPVKAPVKFSRPALLKWFAQRDQQRLASSYDCILTLDTSIFDDISVRSHCYAMLLQQANIPAQPYLDEDRLCLPIRLYWRNYKYFLNKADDDTLSIDFDQARLPLNIFVDVLYRWLGNLPAAADALFQEYDPNVNAVVEIPMKSSTFNSFKVVDKHWNAQIIYGDGLEPVWRPHQLRYDSAQNLLYAQYRNDTMFYNDVALLLRQYKAPDAVRQQLLNKFNRDGQANEHAYRFNPRTLDNVRCFRRSEESYARSGNTNSLDDLLQPGSLLFVAGALPLPSDDPAAIKRPLAADTKYDSTISSSQTFKPVEKFRIYTTDVSFSALAQLAIVDPTELERSWLVGITERLQREMRRTQESYDSAVAEARRLAITLSGQQYMLQSVHNNTGPITRAVEALRQLAGITSVTTYASTLVLQTEDIWVRIDGGDCDEEEVDSGKPEVKRPKTRRFYLGQYTIRISKGFEQISFVNNQMHRADKSGHPHHHSSNLCLSGYEELLSSAIIANDLVQVVLVMLEFLRNVTTTDSLSMSSLRCNFRERKPKQPYRSTMAVYKRND